MRGDKKLDKRFINAFEVWGLLSLERLTAHRLFLTKSH